MDGIETLTKAFGDHSTAVTEALKKASTNDEQLIARVTEIEQKMVRGGGGHTAERPETWGAQVAQAEAMKGIGANWKGTTRISVKATMTTLTTDAAGSAGDLLGAHRGDGVIELPRKKFTLRSLFAPGLTAANSIEWPKQTGRTNNAGCHQRSD